MKNINTPVEVASVEMVVISGLQERMGCKFGVVSEQETSLRATLFGELDCLRQDLLLLELEDNLLASSQGEASEKKRSLITALKDVEAQIKAETDERKQKAMRGAKGRVLVQIEEAKNELNRIFTERGEVLGKIKQVRIERAAIKKQLNNATAEAVSTTPELMAA